MNSFLERFDYDYAPRLAYRATGFRAIFERLEAKAKKYYTIFETGCVRDLGNWEGDGQSTILFDLFVNHYDGRVFSIDLNPVAVGLARGAVSPRTHCVCADAVRFLADMSRFVGGSIEADLLYLDSYDIDFNNPIASSFHHLKEFIAAGRLKSGCIVAIDDNIEVEGKYVGKGMLVEEFMSNIEIKPFFKGHQIIWQMP